MNTSIIEKKHIINYMRPEDYETFEPAKLRALSAYVPTCLACLRAHVPTCLRANVPTCLACSRAHVPMCLTCLCVHVITCSCLACSRVNVPCVLCVATCSRAITANDKYKFSITAVHSCISLTSQNPLTGAMTNFTQRNDLIFV